MIETRQIAEYLETQMKHLTKKEDFYLIEGVEWATRRIKGIPPSEKDFETAPSVPLEEFIDTSSASLKEKMQELLDEIIKNEGYQEMADGAQQMMDLVKSHLDNHQLTTPPNKPNENDGTSNNQV